MIMQDLYHPSGPDFVEKLVFPQSSTLPPRQGYHMVGIYLRDHDSLGPAAVAAESLGFEPINRDRVRQIEGILRSFQNVFWILTLIVVTVVFLSVWNMGLCRIYGRNRR